MDAKNQFPTEGLVRVPQILSYLNMGKTAFWANIQRGKIPQPIRIGGISAWRAADIRALAGE